MPRSTIITPALVLGMAAVAAALSVPGGGAKRNDCAVELQADGLAFPAGNGRPTGVSCADGAACDADGAVNGACAMPVAFCLNVADAALPACGQAEVRSIEVKRGRLKGGGTIDVAPLQAAADALALPTSGAACSAVTALVVPVRGPDRKGELASGTAKIRATAATSRGRDKDRYSLVCRPGAGAVTTTTVPQSTTTTTLAAPGAGLRAEITGAEVDPSGTVRVTFTLTDDTGAALMPSLEATSDPAMARVRLTIARLEVNPQTVEGLTTTFTRYVSYVTETQTGANQPTFDSGGTLVPAGAAGTWTYTFATTLPAGFPGGATHTVGAQIERTAGGRTSVANPVFDFVPTGDGPVMVREPVTTTQCNACHDPLAVHGGGRREVRLCQLCHTDQSVDPQTGNTLDLKHLIHRVHRGKDLPSVTGGGLGASYEFIGFRNSRIVFAETVAACAGGALAGLPCEEDADCPGGTCTGETTTGVGFPKDLRNCDACHAEGATAEDHRELPSTLACTGCHDDVNPGETPTDAGPPGTNHLAGDQPEALCRLCHTPAGEEFDISVPGAHVVPARSSELAGIVAAIESVEGAPGAPLSLRFRVTDGAGTPLPTLAGMGRVALAANGPTTDLGGSSTPVVLATLVGGGSSGTLTGPDAEGVYDYTSSVTLPADASGSWVVGMEFRRSVTLSSGETVQEAAPNPVATFSVDGSEVEPRRTVVEQADCQRCHGQFSVDFSVHGSLRNNVEYCVVCHHPDASDYGRRRNAVGAGADPATATINFKTMIHKIHRGEELAMHPHVIYGFGAAPANFTAHDFSEVLFPGDLRRCEGCHAPDTAWLPLPAGVRPTRRSIVDTSVVPDVETAVGAVPPVQDACLACHDGAAAQAHAATNTTGEGAEACNVCHAEGSVEAVSEVHAR